MQRRRKIERKLFHKKEDCMKNNIVKRLLALGMTTAMVLSMADRKSVV